MNTPRKTRADEKEAVVKWADWYSLGISPQKIADAERRRGYLCTPGMVVEALQMAGINVVKTPEYQKLVNQKPRKKPPVAPAPVPVSAPAPVLWDCGGGGLPPSSIPAPTKEQLMGGHAKIGKAS